MRMSHEIGQNSKEIIQTDNRSSAHSGHANYKCLNKKIKKNVCIIMNFSNWSQWDIALKKMINWVLTDDK